MKKILYICIALTLSLSVYAQSGQDGNVSWQITDSTLTLTGTGSMPDYDYSENPSPWHPHRNMIKTVVIENGLTTIGNSAFALSPALTSVVLNDSITSIGANAFLVCRTLTSISLPDSTKTIGSLAFGACSGLTSIEIPTEVSSIGEGAFSGCSGLVEINISADNITYTSLEGIVFSKDETELFIYPSGKPSPSYTVPDHVTTLGYGAFLNSENLERLELQEGLTTIGREAFYNCRNLSVITIPATVTVIGDNAFHYCHSLDTIEVHWDTPITISPSTYTASSISMATLIIPAASKPAYESSTVWSTFGTITERAGEEDDPTANIPLVASDVSVSYAVGVLYVDSPRPETLKVYSLTGTLFYTAPKSEGKAVFTPNLPNGIYIVTGSSGWSVKVVVY